MPNTNSRILSPSELLDIYGLPFLNEEERQKHFTLNEEEVKSLMAFKTSKDAVYFAICLVFFKIKQTFVDFTYREITAERQHIMNLYFPKQIFPKELPSEDNKFRIKNKILDLCGYQRLTDKIQDQIKQELFQSALYHPRQRQLCKELLNLFVKHRISIPGYSTLQDIISEIWNKENNRVIDLYLRYTNSDQRKVILSLLEKTDDLHHIISIRKDMKSFNTRDLWTEIEKHDQLKPIFEIACLIVDHLSLPATTISYYSNLIHYYSGPDLKQINPLSVGLYLLCYTHTRYQKVNDNLLEAFKKRTLEYKKKATDYAKDQALKYLEIMRDTRERVSNLLITIKYSSHPSHVEKKEIYAHIPEDELLIAANLLVDENFNKDFLFWKHVDGAEESIKLNLRKLFLSIDFIVSNNDPLNQVVSYVKNYFLKGNLDPLPSYVKTWVGKDHWKYIMPNDTVLFNRLEFFLYLKMVYHLGTNTLTLQHSIKYKAVEDDLLNPKKWTREKKTILKTLDYQKLITPIQTTLNEKKETLTALYKTVNAAIDNNENPFILIKYDSKKERTWRLSPLEADPDPNESFLASLQKLSIVEIIQFVNHKVNFCSVFDSILPKSKRGDQNPELIAACILANAIRLGSRKMASISDLYESELVLAEASYLRLETLLPSIDNINNAIAKFPIYKEWYIDSILHGSLDGLKLETSLKNIKARHSRKYFSSGTGVSAYNTIVNFLSVVGQLIGSHEYEGHFTFEMIHHQNTSDIKPIRISTDKHGMNSLNFALFDLTDLVFCPRIPKIHRETLWGFGSPKDYEGFLIKPKRFVDEGLIPEEWDNIQRLVASLLTGEAIPSVIIRKLSSKDYSSKTKKAFVQYNHIVRSQFILTYLHDHEFRRAVMYALNRGEGYNGLYRAISLLNNGELKGKNEIEREIWNQCTRFIASVIHYYNAYILNNFYVNSKDEKEKHFLASLAPTAWVHVNLLGYYQFYKSTDHSLIDTLLSQWDWKNSKNFEKL
ncbi:MAG TPA: Tn3 family transposase [Alphaproteobacteria bacterium]|nr:MAG: hypothetical protein B7X84_08580 [Alphaproteobacteria bacterium 17-39-52]HQS84898.1 Tn3 family transposase [Alphaproteobacteria bacterium]HQS94664.1 Tn3 family transposase [Alphaproteobacteria bacterium]